MATVLIIGASRGIGFETLKAALETGHAVRALARSARRILVSHPKLEKLPATRSMTTVKRADRHRCSHPVAWCFGWARNHLRADEAFLEGDPSARHRDGGGWSQAFDLPPLPRLSPAPRPVTGFLYSVALYLLLGRIYDDKDVQERIVRKSKLDWVILRPVILTSGPRTKAYRALVDPRDWTCGFISRADVADFLVKQIDNGTFLHKTPVLTS